MELRLISYFLLIILDAQCVLVHVLIVKLQPLLVLNVDLKLILSKTNFFKKKINKLTEMRNVMLVQILIVMTVIMMKKQKAIFVINVYQDSILTLRS